MAVLQVRFWATGKISRSSLRCFIHSRHHLVVSSVSFSQMNTSIVHASGAVLLDLNHLENVEQIYRQMMGRMMPPAVEMVPLEGSNAVGTDGAVHDAVHAVDEDMDACGFDGVGDYSGNFGSPGEAEQPEEEKEKEDRRVIL